MAGTVRTWSLVGMKALVIDGTEGIGRTIVQELVQLGCQVYTTSRYLEELTALLQEMNLRGLQVFGCICNLSLDDHWKNLIHQVSELFHRSLDILVDTRMGLSIPASQVREETLPYYTKLVVSCYNVSHLFYPLLKASGHGNLVFLSSVGALVNTYNYYGGSVQGGLNRMARNLAFDWAKDGIRVNCVAPWVVRSMIMESFITQGDFLDQLRSRFQPQDEFLQRLDPRNPLRLSKSEQVSSSVALLCSPAAWDITGQVIAVSEVAQYLNVNQAP